MSKHLINQYYTSLDRAKQFGKSSNEDAIKSYFWILLNDYARKNNYEVVREVYCMGTKGSKVKPDGILKNLFGIDIGLWESKDEKDKIEDEIDNKIKKGYPLTNILFEDSKVAILYQKGLEIKRVKMDDPDKLHDLLTEFVSFKNETVYKFETALENFKADIPALVDTLRKKIDESSKKNKNFIAASESFLELCKAEINPEITDADIREMMIQHILTSDIFNKIFDDPEFHKHNNIGRELETLIEILFSYSERKNLLNTIEHYYDAISVAASGIVDHHEKQKFLKVLYENFYKVYNPKAADRLGVVYTPNEIVQFIIINTDYLLHKHFSKTMADKNVEILDPATGTGTFVTAIIDHLPKKDLAYKYQNEIHANEVAILPYYIANLNIEYTFKQKMQYYDEYKNLCFVDTLDNTGGLAYSGKQHGLFGLSSENAERIKKQNSKKISVIVGNPPYNSNQVSENDNNKKRDYKSLDERIKNTYVKYSSSQKTKVYDMYARFFRWASDRVSKDGIVAFITNNSFIKARGFDGFRKCIQEEFDYAYIIDLDGDVRSNPAQAKGNVFNIMVGVSIAFLIKVDTKTKKQCQIKYYRPDELIAFEKIEILKKHLGGQHFEEIPFLNISPDKNNDWLNIADTDFENLMPLIDKKSKKAIFENITNGISTNRDEWVYDFDKNNLKDKSKFFIKEYNSELERWIEYKRKNKYIDIKAESNPVVDKFLHSKNLIKWSKMLKRDKFRKEKKGKFSEDDLVLANYRPFAKQYLYFGYIPIDLKGDFENYFPKTDSENTILSFSGLSSSQEFQSLVTNGLTSLDFLEKTKCIPLYYFTDGEVLKENITEWGLQQFSTHYKDKKIKKKDIFNYVYAVLNNPNYRIKYELNLKREFPRIPFYKDFWKWSEWGKELIHLHVNYEKVKPYSLKLLEVKEINKKERQGEMFSMAAEPEAMFSRKAKVKVKLKADKEAGEIELDEITTLRGIPKEAWEYKLGNRSALEWILDQYKEKKYSDPTIAEKFNTYKFADYKEQVMDLIKRVTTVSVETMKIIEEMKNEN